MPLALSIFPPEKPRRPRPQGRSPTKKGPSNPYCEFIFHRSYSTPSLIFRRKRRRLPQWWTRSVSSFLLQLKLHHLDISIPQERFRLKVCESNHIRYLPHRLSPPTSHYLSPARSPLSSEFRGPNFDTRPSFSNPASFLPLSLHVGFVEIRYCSHSCERHNILRVFDTATGCSKRTLLDTVSNAPISQLVVSG